MKKSYFVSAAAIVFSLSACVQGDVVQIAKPSDTKTEYVPQATQQPQKSVRELPKNVTAICRDGSYSTSVLSEACLGNGGVQESISRYHSE